MRPNAVRRMLAEGKKVVNGWLAIPSGFSAEMMAHCGFDSVTVDLQHGLVDYQAAVAMLQAVSTTEARNITTTRNETSARRASADSCPSRSAWMSFNPSKANTIAP